MELPSRIEIKGEDNREYVLELLKIIYGLFQESHNWFLKLKGELMSDRGFISYKIDQCVFYRKGLIIITYVDDCI